MPPAVSSLLSLPSKQPVRALGPRSAHRERIGPARRDFAAGAAVEEAVGIGFLRRARRERRQLHEVASVQRELGDLLRGDDLTQRRIRGLHRYFGRAYFNGGGDRGRREGEIQFAMLVHLQPDVFCFDRSEARGFHSDRVDRQRQVRGTRKCPVSSVSASRETFVAWAVTFTFAPATTAPVLSVTVPEKLPVA